MTDSLSSYSDIQKSHKLIIFVSESTFIKTSLVIKVIGWQTCLYTCCELAYMHNYTNTCTLHTGTLSV